MSTKATYDDANLILRLYELRRDDKLRAARGWFATNFAPANMEQAMRLMQPGSEGNTHFRMVSSYWEMAASFVTSGVLQGELFYESGTELLVVWERVRPILPEIREMFKNPSYLENLETVGTAMANRMASQGPEAYLTFQARIRGLAAEATERNQ
jgi:hypothetical protein